MFYQIVSFLNTYSTLRHSATQHLQNFVLALSWSERVGGPSFHGMVKEHKKGTAGLMGRLG